MDLIIEPLTLTQILGFSIGFLYGEAFSKWDYNIKYTLEWYKRLTPFSKWFISSLLDTQHHFQYGLILMLAAKTLVQHSLLSVFLYWIGAGLIVSDWKDYTYVLKRMGLVK